MTKNEIAKKLENHIAVLYEGQYGYQPQTNISVIEGFIEIGCHVTFIHKKDEKVLVSLIDKVKKDKNLKSFQRKENMQ